MRLRHPFTSTLRVLVILAALSLAVTSIALSMGGAAATSIQLANATAAAPIPASQGGGFYIADTNANLVLKVDAGGNITTMAGNGEAGEGGDGGPAVKAQLNNPTDAVPTSDGGILIAESGLFGSKLPPRIRHVSAAGIITTVAGGAASVCPAHTDAVGDGCPATQAVLYNPTAAVPLAGGGFLIAEWGGGDVRKVDASGIITRVAGSDVSNPAFCPAHTDAIGDGCPAVETSGKGALLSSPTAAIPFAIDGAAVATPGSGFLITEEQGCRVRFVNGAGIISTVAGIANPSASCREKGDPAPPATGVATSLKLGTATDARPTAEPGVFLVADGFTCTVYRVNMTNNTYSTFAQDAACVEHGGFLGTTAAIPDPSGGALVADSNSSLIKRATAGGALSVVAGGGIGPRPPDGTPGAPAPSPGPPFIPPLAGGGGGAGGGATSVPAPSTPPPTPAPICRLQVRSGVIPLSAHRRKGSKNVPQPKNTLAVSVTCDQAASATIRGVITEHIRRGHKTISKTVALAARVLLINANGTLSATLNVPASALGALKRGIAESAALVLTGVNANGKSIATAKVARLSLKK